MVFATCFFFLGMRNLKSYVTGSIGRDEDVIFFPTFGWESNETHWDVPIHGWIFEPERQDKKRRAFLALTRKSLKVDKVSEAFLTRRLASFLVDNERWKSPRITTIVDNHKAFHRLPVSEKNGHFQGTIQVSKELTKHLEDGLLPIKVSAPDGRDFQGRVHLIPATGLSVISDIDDTIKISNVTNIKSLLKNTFLEDFKQVPGMAQIYKDWEEKLGAKFHFVSSSPYQLYEDLEAFRKRSGFPSATFHLKRIRPKSYKSLLSLKGDPFKTKTATITSIIDRFPERKFIFVGDSGEKDPEVYGNLARLYPNQIVHIYIRKVSAKKYEEDESFDERMAAVFANIPPEKFTLFEKATEISPSPNEIL